MQHYEIILQIKPDSDQVSDMIERYSEFVQSKAGIVHYAENIGRENIFPCKKFTKAYFVRMNIKADALVQDELVKKFILNDEILRYFFAKRTDDTIRTISFLQNKEPDIQRKSFSTRTNETRTEAI